MAEAIFAYRMTKQGKTPKEIRAAIMHGDYNNMDLAKVDDIQ